MQLNRRAILENAFLLAGAGAMSSLGLPAMAATARRFFERIRRPIGLQLYTLGEEAARDLDATFATVARIGYRDIELPSLYGRTPQVLRAAADRAGLAISSLHLPVTPNTVASGALTMTSPVAQIAESLGALGAKRAVLPIAPFPANSRPLPGETRQGAIARAFAEAGDGLWKRTAALLNERGSALKSAGVQVGYHNHNVEFAPIGQTSGWDILVGETDPALVHFEIDTGWVVAAGLDPIAFLGKLKGRVAQLHVKDVAAIDAPDFALSMKPAQVGTGKLDWARILPAAHAAGARHFYVEQEPPFPGPRIDAVRGSYAFLSQLRA